MSDKASDTEEKEKFGRVQFSHEELVKLTKEAIGKVIESDPLFSGLPPDATAEEIRAQTEVAQGQAITLYLSRGPLSRLPIVVPSHATSVLDLKKAIKRCTNLALRREQVERKISWKHVWKTYNVCCDSAVLTNDSENIKNYGVINRTELRYSKKRREKNKNL